MKIRLSILLLGALVTSTRAQWNNAGDNSTTGNLSVSGTISTGQIQMTSNDGQTGFYIQKPTATGQPFTITLGYQDISGGIMIGRADWGSKVLIPWYLGLGTNSPAARFHIQQTAEAWTEGMRLSSNGKNWDFVLDTNGERLIIAKDQSLDNGFVVKSGNFGIGTGSPVNKFQIGPNTSNWSNNDLVVGNANGSLAISTGSSDTYLYGSKDISVRPGGTQALYAKTNGYVGIGTITPNNKLQIGPNNIGYSNNDLVVSNSNGTLAIHNDPSHTYLYGTQDIAIRPGNGQMAIYAKSNGNVGIGTDTPGSFKLAVNGKVWAQEVQVALTNPGPDYVFEPDYKLLSLEEIKSYIEKNKHLPEVPSAKEMETNGVNVSEMNILLLKKIEEMTLYVIEQNNQLVLQQKAMTSLYKRIDELEEILKRK